MQVRGGVETGVEAVQRIRLKAGADDEGLHLLAAQHLGGHEGGGEDGQKKNCFRFGEAKSSIT